MSWRYECDDCPHRTQWMSRADAESARFRHHDNSHDGKAAAREGFTSNNRDRVAGNPRQLAFAGFLFALTILYALWEKLT